MIEQVNKNVVKITKMMKKITKMMKNVTEMIGKALTARAKTCKI